MIAVGEKVTFQSLDTAQRTGYIADSEVTRDGARVYRVMDVLDDLASGKAWRWSEWINADVIDLHAKVEAQELAEKVRGLERANVVEAAVWGELNKRRWFGRHVEEDEMESLVVDLRTAIAGAVVASSEDVSP